MSNYLLWQLLSHGVMNSTDFNYIKMDQKKREFKTTNNYTKYADSVVRPNTAGNRKNYQSQMRRS